MSATSHALLQVLRVLEEDEVLVVVLVDVVQKPLFYEERDRLLEPSITIHGTGDEAQCSQAIGVRDRREPDDLLDEYARDDHAVAHIPRRHLPG